MPCLPSKKLDVPLTVLEPVASVVAEVVVAVKSDAPRKFLCHNLRSYLSCLPNLSCWSPKTKPVLSSSPPEEVSVPDTLHIDKPANEEYSPVSQ